MATKTKEISRAIENDFTQFDDEEILSVYNHFSPRKLLGFMDRYAMERRTTDLLDSRGLMIYHAANGAELYSIGRIHVYRAESHPKNVYSLGYVHQDSNRIIRLLIPYNPKRGVSKERFALYRDGMTVYEYRVACRDKFGGNAWEKADSDLDWDIGRGFIKIEYDKHQDLSDHAAELLKQQRDE